MRKLLIWLIALFMILMIFVVAAGVLAFNYVKPEVERDLAFEAVPLGERALDMAQAQSSELVLTSEDVNWLAKKALAENPRINEDIEITGADFILDGNRLTAYLNVIWKGRVRAEARAVYALKWENPVLVAVPLSAKLKDFDVSKSMFEERTIPLGDELPKTLDIQEIEWGRDELTVIFRQPDSEALQTLAEQQ